MGILVKFFTQNNIFLLKIFMQNIDFYMKMEKTEFFTCFFT